MNKKTKKLHKKDYKDRELYEESYKKIIKRNKNPLLPGNKTHDEKALRKYGERRKRRITKRKAIGLWENCANLRYRVIALFSGLHNSDSTASWT